MGILKRYGAWVVLTLAIVVIGSTAEAQSRFWVLVNGALRYTGGQVQVSDGTSGSPAYTFASEPTLGFYRSGAATITAQATTFATSNSISVGNSVNATTGINITGKWKMLSPADGIGTWSNNTGTIGIELKADALPSYAAGFSSVPGGAAVTALSTPLFGSISVGTGTMAASGTVNFNGTAFPTAPQTVICQNTTTLQLVRCTATTTVLTITGNGNFTASDVISWVVGSSK